MDKCDILILTIIISILCIRTFCRLITALLYFVLSLKRNENNPQIDETIKTEDDALLEQSLHEAIKRGEDEKVRRLLIETAVDVNSKDKWGETPLHNAVNRAALAHEKKYRNILQYLMESNEIEKSVTMENKHERTPLLKFIEDMGKTSNFTMSKHIGNCLKILIKKVKLGQIKHLLVTAITTCSYELCEFLLENKANPNDFYLDEFDFSHETALHCAIRSDSTRKCKLLIKYGANLDTKWKRLTPLEYAISISANNEIIMTLAESEMKRVRETKDDFMRKIQKCLETYCIVGETPLTCSVRLGIKSWVKYFLEKEDIFKPDKTGLSALELSQKYSYIRKIIRKRVNFNKLNSKTKQKCQSLRKWYKFRKSCSTTLKLSKTSDENNLNRALNAVEKCVVLPSTERTRIQNAIERLAQKISNTLENKIPGADKFGFKPILAGSTADRTKTYVPNEFDIICEFKNIDNLKISNSGEIKLQNIAQWKHLCNSEQKLIERNFQTYFYFKLEQALEIIVKEGIQFDKCLHLPQKPFLLKEKISSLYVLWRGVEFPDMKIFVDLVPAFPAKTLDEDPPESMEDLNTDYPDPDNKNVDLPAPKFNFITKVPRHNYSLSRTAFHISASRVEKSQILRLPVHIRNALIYAKAFRIGAICTTKESALPFLKENINIEDYVTSYMLKTCLFLLLQEMDENSPMSAIGWSKQIYLKLKNSLAKEHSIESYISDRRFLDVFMCYHEKQSLEYACCHKKYVMFEICKQIMNWINDNQSKLEILFPSR